MQHHIISRSAPATNLLGPARHRTHHQARRPAKADDAA